MTTMELNERSECRMCWGLVWKVFCLLIMLWGIFLVLFCKKQPEGNFQFFDSLVKMNFNAKFDDLGKLGIDFKKLIVVDEGLLI